MLRYRLSILFPFFLLLRRPPVFSLFPYTTLFRSRFDGAWLVQNFENLNPANTLWNKQYHLYSNIDTEAPRYLGFEKYWGGYVYLIDVEMQYIVDNLFICNRFAPA